MSGTLHLLVGKVLAGSSLGFDQFHVYEVIGVFLSFLCSPYMLWYFLLTTILSVLLCNLFAGIVDIVLPGISWWKSSHDSRSIVLCIVDIFPSINNEKECENHLS